MSKFELKLPQMGESVAEATLTSWLKEVGDTIEMDEAVFEIATDKVDSEVPSEVDGVLLEKKFNIDDIIQVGDVVAVIEIEGEAGVSTPEPSTQQEAAVAQEPQEVAASSIENEIEAVKERVAVPAQDYSTSKRFYSPLVKNIAKQEGITRVELDSIAGTGKEGRVTKADILAHIAHKKEEASSPQKEDVKIATPEAETVQPKTTVSKESEKKEAVLATNPGDEIIPLSRMGKLIAKHMTHSVTTSAHVQSFIEVDVTNIVTWRNKIKKTFEQREGEKLTFTPIFMEAVAKALKNFPMMNISLEGDTVIKKKNINIGMAAALPDGNLIVPVIKNADQLNLVGMTKMVNDLANRSRTNALKPDEIQDGTYTVTNVGSFGSVFGTPIINQPQVGILALGAIRKVPSVIETADGDFIGIRSKMFLSHSYDHRVVNGALGGMFVKAIADYLEAWDTNREI